AQKTPDDSLPSRPVVSGEGPTTEPHREERADRPRQRTPGPQRKQERGTEEQEFRESDARAVGREEVDADRRNWDRPPGCEIAAEVERPQQRTPKAAVRHRVEQGGHAK